MLAGVPRGIAYKLTTSNRRLVAKCCKDDGSSGQHHLDLFNSAYKCQIISGSPIVAAPQIAHQKGEGAKGGGASTSQSTSEFSESAKLNDVAVESRGIEPSTFEKLNYTLHKAVVAEFAYDPPNTAPADSERELVPSIVEWGVETADNALKGTDVEKFEMEAGPYNIVTFSPDAKRRMSLMDRVLELHTALKKKVDYNSLVGGHHSLSGPEKKSLDSLIDRLQKKFFSDAPPVIYILSRLKALRKLGKKAQRTAEFVNLQLAENELKRAKAKNKTSFVFEEAATWSIVLYIPSREIKCDLPEGVLPGCTIKVHVDINSCTAKATVSLWQQFKMKLPFFSWAHERKPFKVSKVSISASGDVPVSKVLIVKHGKTNSVAGSGVQGKHFAADG